MHLKSELTPVLLGVAGFVSGFVTLIAIQGFTFSEVTTYNGCQIYLAGSTEVDGRYSPGSPY